MNHIYCISGLGADHRIFQKLRIDNGELHFIQWEMPGVDDTMRSYALKLAQQIKHEEIILVGVSFGGMLATEINNYYQNVEHDGTLNEKGLNPNMVIRQTILISSCKNQHEFPGLMQLAGKMKLHKAVPYQFVLRNKTLNRFVFDLRSNEEELYLKRVMLRENQVKLIKRSINIILGWKAGITHSVVHIHGTSDRLLSPGNITADHWVENGGHFMVWNRAEEVSTIINALLK